MERSAGEYLGELRAFSAALKGTADACTVEKIEARRQEKYERLKIAAQKAAAAKEEGEETLRRRWKPGRQSLR
jgi:hypothetical protein